MDVAQGQLITVQTKAKAQDVQGPRIRLIPLASGPCLLDQCTVLHQAGAVEAQHVRWFVLRYYLLAQSPTENTPAKWPVAAVDSQFRRIIMVGIKSRFYPMATDKEGGRERINAIPSAKPIIFSGPGTGKLQWTVTTFT